MDDYIPKEITTGGSPLWRARGTINGIPVRILLNIGCPLSLIDLNVAEKAQLKSTHNFEVPVVNRYVQQQPPSMTKGRFTNIPIVIQGQLHRLCAAGYELGISEEVVLGAEWFYSRPITSKGPSRTLEFSVDGIKKSIKFDLSLIM